MKRLISILCIMAMTLSLFSCGPSLAGENMAQTATGQGQTQTSTKEEKPDASKIKYPSGFSVGYAREDVSPEETPIIMNGETKAERIHDPVQLTCTAMCDGKNVLLLMSVDLRGVPEKFVNKCKDIITKKVGVPAENILINATHTHTAPDNEQFDKDAVVIRWQKMFYQKLENAVVKAMLDLTPAEAYVGSAKTEGITFTRRFKRDAEGNPLWNTTKTDAVHESEADSELRTIRFDRGSKKDVLLVNYQTHYGGATGLYPNQISADFVHNFRESAEKDLDVLFAYHQGAGGNLNFRSPVPGNQLYDNYVKTIPEFMETTQDAIKGEKKVNTGEIKVATSKYQATVWEVDAQTLADAKEVNAITNSADKKAAMAAKGFEDEKQVAGIISRAKIMDQVAAGDFTNTTIPFTAVSIGDIAFAAAPYEMFDTNGMEIRAASPYEMTFICAYTNGHMGYIPSSLAFPNGGYEIYVNKYKPGSGEEFAQELVRLLNECK